MTDWRGKKGERKRKRERRSFYFIFFSYRPPFRLFFGSVPLENLEHDTPGRPGPGRLLLRDEPVRVVRLVEEIRVRQLAVLGRFEPAFASVPGRVGEGAGDELD